MTIKELENRTGMARANIRFYENEGLLAPERLDNGYRDYSEEDVRTLEKIRLLRQLQLDLDTIRTVQQGALTLEQALFAQLTKLEGDKAVIERAAQVCRELERSGVEYGALDPQPYLRRLESPAEPPREALPPPTIPRPQPDPTPRACWHPWQRLFARMLDVTLYSAVFDVLWLALLRDQTLPLASGLAGWALNLIALAFALVAAEPLWLHYWGWTPGKWLFGLKIRDGDGNKLTLAQGFQRSCQVIWEGYGLNIPIWSLWKMWKCRKLGLEGRDCCWDGENDYRYTKEERRFSAGIFVGVNLLCSLALFLSFQYTRTPPNQGGLTVAEFSENYNYYFKQLVDQGSTGLPTMGDDGRWVEREAPQGTVVINMFGDTTVWDDPVFTVTGGRVLAVKLHMESEDSLVGGGTRELLAVLAMTGALDGLNLFDYDLPGWARMYEEQLSSWADADLIYRGLRVTQEVEYDGYSNMGGQLWQVDQDAPRHCEKTLTISLAEP